MQSGEKRKVAGAKKDVHIRHTHKLSTGLSLRFEVRRPSAPTRPAARAPRPQRPTPLPFRRAPPQIIDNVATLSEPDWRRVVAVIVQGSSWQFKGWPFKDTVSTFANVRGFHVRYADEVPPQMIQSSDVKTLVLSQDKRYMDASVAKDFWHSLEKFLVTSKRALLSLQ